MALISRLHLYLRISQSVIVYRSSPAQKASIVGFVKRNVKDSVTVSIGDGGNDVNMIQTAHVGVGLYGKEGEQAASFSDYALPEFKHLRRLTFVHGRSVALKLSNFTAWFIFKMC